MLQTYAIYINCIRFEIFSSLALQSKLPEYIARIAHIPMLIRRGRLVVKKTVLQTIVTLTLALFVAANHCIIITMTTTAVRHTSTYGVLVTVGGSVVSTFTATYLHMARHTSLMKLNVQMNILLVNI